jgi:hypothetical protein
MRLRLDDQVRFLCGCKFLTASSKNEPSIANLCQYVKQAKYPIARSSILACLPVLALKYGSWQLLTLRVTPS